ncbi:MAG: hypothetical protein DRI95_02980 [Bacteroidetes bacterium]|nr:MAG: hypothetical protein DRI95_02980 [Bacteroidota bacterium]
MKNFLILFILSFVLSFPNLYGQSEDSLAPISQKKNVKYLDIRFENGAMLSNNTDVGDQLVNSSYYNGLDVRLGFRRTDPDDVYSNVYRRPYFGLGWYSSTFQNADVGKPHALYFFLTLPIKFEQNRKFTSSYTAAFGLSYKFNPYDSINNPANIFIGSYRNCYVHFGYVANYKFNEKWAINGTIGFKHFSNGSFKQPNYGINLIPFTLGASYRFGDDEIYQQPKQIADYKRHNLVNVTFTAGSKNYVAGEDNYLKTAYGVNFLRQINYKYRIGIGFDLFYAAQSDLRNSSDASHFSKSYSYAIVGSWEWALTKNLYVPVGLAIYLHRNEENDERTAYYERAGIRYRFADHYTAGITIKAHQGVADIFEWSIGYTFHKDPNEY